MTTKKTTGSFFARPFRHITYGLYGHLFFIFKRKRRLEGEMGTEKREEYFESVSHKIQLKLLPTQMGV